MKLSNYQKAMLIWAVLLFFGFTFSQFSASLVQMFIVWVVIVAIALFSQFYLLWRNSRAVIITHLTWLFISLEGSIYTYFAVTGQFITDLKLSVFWLMLTAAGMVVTGFVEKSKSYYLLALLYAAAGLALQVITTQYDILATGVIFLVLGILDVYLETTSLRKKPAANPVKTEPATSGQL